MGSFIILMHFGEISTLEWKVGLHVVLAEAVPSAFGCNINVALWTVNCTYDASIPRKGATWSRINM